MMIEPKKPFLQPSLDIAEIQSIDTFSISGNQRTGWDTFDYYFDFDN